MLRRVALVRTDVSDEPRAAIIRVIRIGDRGTTLTTDARCEEIQSAQRASVANVVPRSPRSSFLQNFGSYNSHTA
jgi:hypothetical protein